MLNKTENLHYLGNKGYKKKITAITNIIWGWGYQILKGKSPSEQFTIPILNKLKLPQLPLIRTCTGYFCLDR